MHQSIILNYELFKNKIKYLRYFRFDGWQKIWWLKFTHIIKYVYKNTCEEINRYVSFIFWSNNFSERRAKVWRWRGIRIMWVGDLLALFKCCHCLGVTSNSTSKTKDMAKKTRRNKGQHNWTKQVICFVFVL